MGMETSHKVPEAPPSKEALAGLKALEFEHLIANPFAAKTLADSTAEGIKVEPVGGDPRHESRILNPGISIWRQVHPRNKRSLGLDQGIVRKPAPGADELIKDFRPDAMECLGLAPADLLKLNPRLVILHISAYRRLARTAIVRASACRLRLAHHIYERALPYQQFRATMSGADSRTQSAPSRPAASRPNFQEIPCPYCNYC